MRAPSPGVVSQVVLFCLHEGEDLVQREVGGGEVHHEVTAQGKRECVSHSCFYKNKVYMNIERQIFHISIV